jgi:ParB/RepB/Spo0J family partition protein
MTDTDRRRAASRTGALSRVLQEISATVPAPKDDSDRPSTNQTRERPIYFPTKGPARIPARYCRPWRFSDRPENEFEHLDSLAQSIKSDGQIQPIVVRPLDPPDGDFRYEVIAGRVRWRTAMQSDSEIDVIVRPLDDKQAFRIMCAENAERRGISDYAKALSYSRALEDGLYRNATELAEQLGLSKSTLSYFLGFAGLDKAVVQKLAKPHALSLRLGYALATAVSDGHLADVLRDLPRIEAGEISREDIPAIWKSNVPSEAAIRLPDKRATSPHTHKFQAEGRVVFQAKVSGSGAAVIRFPTKSRVQFRDAFWEELEALVKKYRRSES